MVGEMTQTAEQIRPTAPQLGASSTYVNTTSAAPGTASRTAWAGVGNGNGTMDTGFAHTATISGIELLDATGKLIPNFSIASGSGTLYTSNGVQTVVPEVGSLLLIVGGTLPGLVWLRQKRG